MKCKAIHKKLIFFLDKELPKEEMHQISIHIKTCKDCMLFIEDLQKTLAVIDAEKKPETNPYLYTRIKAKLQHPTAAKVPVGWFTRLKPALQAAAFSILLVVGVYGGSKIGNMQQHTTQTTLAQQYVIPYLNEMENEPIETFLLD